MYAVTSSMNMNVINEHEREHAYGPHRHRRRVDVGSSPNRFDSKVKVQLIFNE
jgi:hypothetical protein